MNKKAIYLVMGSVLFHGGRWTIRSARCWPWTHAWNFMAWFRCHVSMPCVIPPWNFTWFHHGITWNSTHFPLFLTNSKPTFILPSSATGCMQEHVLLNKTIKFHACTTKEPKTDKQHAPISGRVVLKHYTWLKLVKRSSKLEQNWWQCNYFALTRVWYVDKQAELGS